MADITINTQNKQIIPTTKPNIQVVNDTNTSKIKITIEYDKCNIIESQTQAPIDLYIMTNIAAAFAFLWKQTLKQLSTQTNYKIDKAILMPSISFSDDDTKKIFDKVFPVSVFATMLDDDNLYKLLKSFGGINLLRNQL